MINIPDDVSTNAAYAISTNVTGTASINSDEKKLDIKWIVSFHASFY